MRKTAQSVAAAQEAAREKPAQVIYLDPDDDAAVVRDRLEWAEAERVLLVLPWRNRALRSLVSLKLIARYASSTGRVAALVTPDPRVSELATEAGLTTFSSIEHARRSQWLKSIDETPPSHLDELVTAYDEVTEPEKVAGISLPERPLRKVVRPKWLPVFHIKPRRRLSPSQVLMRRLLSALGFLILLAVLSAMIGVVVLLLYPQGSIHLRPKRIPVQTELTLRADPQAEKINYQTLDIPARLAQVELRDVGVIAPSGASALPTERASGAVTFINRTLQEVTVPISTTVSTSRGLNIRFTTNITVTVPAAVNATAVVTVTAVDPGPIGNVAAGQINRIENPVLARQLAVINELPTSGGAVKQAGVVTREDKDRLWSIVLQKMYQVGYSRLKEELAEQEFLPPESVIVLPLEGIFTPSLDGEQADQLSLDMHAVVRGTVIATQHANRLGLAALQAELPREHKLDPRSLQFEIGEVLSVADDRSVTFTMRASGEAIAQIDVDRVASIVRGLPVDQAQQLLAQQLPLAETPLVSVTPNWLGRLPWLPFRIQVNVVE
ncbi:MAG: baseplate J/gp47 family protein [Anaerolineae bacterium]|nr:baseplate J/gp47 family protein [Anaerolineae bacterium]MDW8070995.1 baseplate J/gp47 family protein [Anaerolineae bacterium]